MAKDDVIGLSIGLDTTNLKAGLQDASRRIKEINATFYSETAGMEKWWEDAEGLNAKLKQLNSTFNVQKKALALLEKEYEDAGYSQDDMSKTAVELRTKISKQKGEIAKTEKAIDKYNKELEQAEKAEKDLGNEVDKTTKDLKEQEKQTEKTGDGFTVFKGIVANVAASIITGLSSAFNSAIDNAIELNRELGMLEATAKSTGAGLDVARENLNKVAAITNDTGAAVEGLNNLMTAGFDGKVLNDITDLLTSASIKWKDTLKFEGLADGLQETLATGSAIGPFAELLERSGIALETFNEGLALATTEAEKQQYILDVLSKTGLLDTLNAYKETNGVLIEYNEAALENKQAMADLGEALLPVKTFLLEIGTALVKYVTPAIETATPYIEKIGGMLVDLFTGNFSSEQLGDVFDFVANAAENLLNKVIELIPQLTQTLITLLPTILSKLTETIPVVIGFITDLIPTLVQHIVTSLPVIVPMLLKFITDVVVAIVESLPMIIDMLLEVLPDIIDAIITSLVTAIPLLIDAAIQLLNALIVAIPIIIESLLEHLPAIIDAIVSGLLSALPVLIEGAIQLFLAILDAIPVLIEALIPLIPTIITTIAEILLNNYDAVFKAAVEVLLAILKAIPEIIVELVKQVPSIIKAIVNGLAEGWDNLKESGVSLLEGLWEGIVSGAKWLKEKITGFAGDVAGWFKDTFKINSPSLLMKKEIGVNLGYGVGEGVVESLPVVKRDIDKFNKQVIDGFNVDSPDFNNKGGSLTGSSNVTTNNRSFVQNIYTSKRISPDEVYRKTGNLLDLDKAVTQ